MQEVRKNEFGDRVYPVYTFNARWSEDGKQDPEYPARHEGLAAGRVWNGSGRSIMPRVEYTESELAEQTAKFINGIKNDKRSKNVDDLTVDAKLKGYFPWHLTWFAHETYRDGMTDEQAMRSFDSYVSFITDRNYGKPESEQETLMGAEDRWRWRGFTDREHKIECPPPCQCPDCKKLDMIRIIH